MRKGATRRWRSPTSRAATARVRSCAKRSAPDFPGGTYQHLFYVADVAASGEPIDAELHVDLDEGFSGDLPARRPRTRAPRRDRARRTRRARRSAALRGCEQSRHQELESDSRSDALVRDTSITGWRSGSAKDVRFCSATRPTYTVPPAAGHEHRDRRRHQSRLEAERRSTALPIRSSTVTKPSASLSPASWSRRPIRRSRLRLQTESSQI